MPYLQASAQTQINQVFEYSDTVKINYCMEGNGKDVLVLLHGLGASSTSWEEITPLFPLDKYKLYLVDLKGHGLSSKPDDNKYSIEDHGLIISAFIEKIVKDKVILVGHSFGGSVALCTYITQKEHHNLRIKKLVLLDCGAFKDEIPFFVYYLKIPIINVPSQSLFSPQFRAKVTLKRLFFDKKRITDKILARYTVYFKDKDAKKPLRETAAQIIPPDYNSLIEKYKGIKVPTLIIWGEKDRVLSIENGQKLNQIIHSSQLQIVPQCGHVPQEECPEQTYKILEKFVSNE